MIEFEVENKQNMPDENRAHESPAQVLGKLLLFTLLMCFLPVLAYYLSKKYFFEDYLQYPVSASSIYAALPAVITVNMIIAAYVYVAWHSEPWSDQPPAPVITTQPVARTDKKKD